MVALLFTDPQSYDNFRVPGVFISYRREDSQAVAGRLVDRLVRHFGEAQVFRDLDSIHPGARFAEVIAESIRNCDALVALIGKGWLDAKDSEGRRRLDSAQDYVKLEIAAALSQNKLVIPVLIEGAAMPDGRTLPVELVALCERNAIPLEGDARFAFDTDRLIQALEERVARLPELPVTISITLDQYEQRMRKREAEIRAEMAKTVTTDQERIALLEKELAAAQAQAGSPARGLQEFKDVLHAASESLERLEPAVSLSELANARQSLAVGETEQAQRLFQRVLDHGKADAAEAAYQLGKLAENRIDYAVAEGHLLEAVRLQPENTLYLNDAGLLSLTLGRFAQAELLMRRALQIDEASYGADHPNVARDLNNLAQLLQATNRLREAEPLMRRALQIDEASYGADHPDVARDLNNLALLLKATNRLTEAEPLMRRALLIFETSLGSEHPNSVTVRDNYSILRAAMNPEEGDAALGKHA